MNLQPKDQEDRSQIVPSAAFYDAPRGTRDNQRILFCVHIYIYINFYFNITLLYFRTRGRCKTIWHEWYKTFSNHVN